MRRLLAVTALLVPPLVIALGCETPPCETAATALCHRANECSTTDESVFVEGSLEAGYSVVNYGTISSCEHQVGAGCEGSTASPAQLDACYKVAFNASCGEVPTAKGAILPAECVGVIVLPPPPPSGA
jgi:hypothetical protein